MINALVTRPSLNELGFGGKSMGFGLNPDTLFERFFNLPMNQPNLMGQYRKEDGTAVFEYNLAGFREDEISVNIDTALHDLIIKAERKDENNMRRFATTVSLSPYTSPEDLNISLENGVLTVEIAPLEQRKQEALISLPLGKKTEKPEKMIEQNQDTSTG